VHVRAAAARGEHYHIITSTLNQLLAEGTDWQFLNALKRPDLKVRVALPETGGSWLISALQTLAPTTGTRPRSDN
jgi:hypothetical protein